jgi:hypothetical protein
MPSIYSQFLSPSDLVLVRRVLDHICAERAIAMPSPQANDIAASLVHAFQHGAREERGLIEALDRAKAH